MGLLACYEVWVCGRSWVRATAGAIVKRVFHPAKKLVRFSLLNSEVVPVGSVSYKPSASPSYEASSHVKNYALIFQQIFIIKKIKIIMQ